MIAAAPKGRPRGGSVTNNSKKPCPPCLKRGPEAGFHRIHYDFQILGANTLFMPVSTEKKYPVCPDRFSNPALSFNNHVESTVYHTLHIERHRLILLLGIIHGRIAHHLCINLVTMCP